MAVTGSTGLIGTALVASLRADGHEVIPLARRGAGTGAAAGWDPGAADGGLDPAAMAGVTAVVHLAGAGIADQRWTDDRKAEIRDSRVRGTRALATGLARLDQPPTALVCGSAIGWYGDTGNRETDESAPAGSGFLADLVRDWEAAAEPASVAGIRTAHLRTGLVLSPQGGTLGRLVPLFRLGLGLPLGPGTQYMSWISLADEVAALRFLLDRPDVTGPVNGTAPGPVTNADFTAALTAALGRPALLRLPVPGLRLPASLLRVPTPALRLALGEMAGELLASARVLPHRLLEAGYPFRHPDITTALAYATKPSE
ncbi:MAG TPA: TIGR01777 family oxidoreductase [Streptosporangiaceae bacterium]